jgi:hypothetical protein
MEDLIGGLRKKDNNITSFQAVYNMLRNDTAEVKVISYKSLSGMIFTVNIKNDPQFVEYLDGKEIDVYSIALKFVIISETWQESLSIMVDTERNEYKKIAETLPDFSKEAQTQSIIFEKSENDPICPSVLDLSFFEYDFGREIIDLLLKKTKHTNTKLSLEWLLKRLNNEKHKLGMITMEFANNYIQLAEYRSDRKKDTYIEAIMLIVLLFLQTGVVLLDCHSGNIMVNPETGRVIIIDFGRTLNIDNEKDDLFLRNNLYKNTIGMKRQILNNCINTLKTAQHAFNVNKYEAIDFINTFNALVSLDFLFNNISFRSQHPQLTNVENAIHRYSITNDVILPILKGSIKIKFPNTKLELFSFKDTLDAYIRQREDTVSPNPTNQGESLEMIIANQQTSLEVKVENIIKIQKIRSKHIVNSKKNWKIIKRFFSDYPADFYNELKEILYLRTPEELHFYIACLTIITENPNEAIDFILDNPNKYINFQRYIYIELLVNKSLLDNNKDTNIDAIKEGLMDTPLTLLESIVSKRKNVTGGKPRALSRCFSEKKRRCKRTKNHKRIHRKTIKY